MVHMPMPSAHEMNPSDGAVAVFGRVLLWTTIALVFGGALSMAVLLVPGPIGDISSGAGMGAAIGLGVAFFIAPTSGIVTATLRNWLRRSLVRCLLGAIVLWLAWIGVLALVLHRWEYSLLVWDNMWPFIPGLVVALLTALLIGWWLHRTEDPLSEEDIRELARAERARKRAERPGARGRQPKKKR